MIEEKLIMILTDLLKTKVRGAITIIAFAILCFPASANLIANAGFEDPVAFAIPPFDGNWQKFSASAASSSDNSTLMPRTGAQSLLLKINGAPNNFTGVFQDIVSLMAGDEVMFSGWHKSDPLFDQGGVEIRIEWRNMLAGTEISRTSNLIPTTTNNYSQFLLSSIVPVGADIARVVYAIQSFGAGANQQVFLDDTSFTVVPEPSMFALLGLGFVGLIFTRRKIVL